MTIRMHNAEGSINTISKWMWIRYIEKQYLVSPEISHVKPETRVHVDICATRVDGPTIRRRLVWVESAMRAVLYHWHATRYSQPEYPMISRTICRCHDNCNCFRKHNLVRILSMDINRWHKTWLCGMCMDPSKRKKWILILILKNLFFICCITRVRCGLLLGNNKCRHKELSVFLVNQKRGKNKRNNLFCLLKAAKQKSIYMQKKTKQRSKKFKKY
jgi:hypothetical protein